VVPGVSPSEVLGGPTT